MRFRAATLSALIHASAVVVLLLLAIYPPLPNVRLAEVSRVAPLHAIRLKYADAGGGDRSPLPAQRGRTPQPVVHRIYLPPMVPQNQQPKLIVEQALLDAPEFNLATPQIGDPHGTGILGQGGPGGPTGIGGAGEGGIGGGGKSGVGGPPASRPAVRLTRQPEVLYQPEPEYSEEARKAHHQGTVVLSIEIDANGKPRQIRVVNGLGLGLDEKAIEAVEQWRFRPALAGNQPVAVEAQVEVSFHLL